MLEKRTQLNIVRIGSYMTFSSLKEIGKRIVETFAGLIGEFSLSHYNAPVVESIDAYLLTMVLHDKYGGPILCITDPDLKNSDREEYYKSLVGGENTQKKVALGFPHQIHP
ncbi:MAG: hypothetical protein H8D61_01935, partial [Deltaproteobacteria bacterium]|nr:hypothetical protein [Deltaproteobacteria bacterium]